jgi:hypothetical protein
VRAFSGVRIRWLFVLAVLAFVAAPMPFARACSCGGGDPREMLQHAGGAFVGTVVSGRDASPPNRKVGSSSDPWDWTFRVEEAVKGNIGDEVVVRSGQPSGGTCGLDLERGQRVGLLLERDDGIWQSGSCSIVDADELHRVGQPPPTPGGRGPPAFLAATTGEHSVVTLDGQGRVLRYGDGKDFVKFDVCSGGKWAAEVDEVSGFVDGRPYIALGRRKVETLELRDTERLVPLELPEPDEPFSVMTISCRDPTAIDAYVFAEHPGSGHDLLLRVTDGRIRRVLKEHIGAVAFSPIDEVAYITTGKAGTERDIMALDLRTLDRRPIATVSGGVSALDVDATGTRILGRAVLDVRTESGRPSVELFTVGVDGKNLRTRKATAGNARWVGALVAATRWDAGLDIFDAQLRPVTSEPRWKGGITPVGERIFGAWDGTLRYTDTTGKPIRPLSDLNLTLSSLTEVPQAGDAVSTEAQRPRLTWTAIALLVLMVALAAIMIRSRRTPAPDRTPPDAP